MSLVAEFDFEVLEPLAPPPAPLSEAEAVMDGLAEARAEAEQIRQAAFADGYAGGRAEAVAALEPALATLGAAAAQEQAEPAAAAVELERRAVELGLALAQKVLAGAVAVEPEQKLDA